LGSYDLFDATSSPKVDSPPEEMPEIDSVGGVC